MKLHFIINPAAGRKNRAGELAERIRARFAAEQEIHITKAPGDATAIARRISAGDGRSLVVVCGGDGTVNEAVTGIAGSDRVSLACYPCGSGNDFVKCMGYSGDAVPELEALVNGEPRDFDVISCGDRRAINVCSVGLDASVAAHAQRIKRFPFVTGKASYTLAIPGRVLGKLGQDYSVKIDGEELDGNYVILVAANGICYGGSYYPMKDADPCDGRLEFLLVRRMSHLKLPGILARYRKGLWAEAGEYFTRRSGKTVEISSEKTMYINLDGEVFSQNRTKFSLEGLKVRFLVPRCGEKC